MGKGYFEDEVDVLKLQREKLKKVYCDYSDLNSEIDDLEARLKEFMKVDKLPEFEDNNEGESSNITKKLEVLEEKNFGDLLKEAHVSGFKNVDIYDVAIKEEVEEANNLLKKYYVEFTEEYKLDKYDYAISGITGTIAAFIDYFLVTKVSGGKVSAGPLKSGVENIWEKLLSEDKIKFLEEKYKVSYDISTNTSKISQEVLGLCPKYHRFQSLGHDPILGLVFGVADLMKGNLTAIDKSGRVIIQSVSGAEPLTFIDSVITVFGHFLSDVATKSPKGQILSVPAPFTPLLQLINAGSISYNGKSYTVSDLSRRMYQDGYNFNHFVGMAAPVVFIEILVRLSFLIKEMFYLKKDVSLIKNPKLTTMLCISNGILFAENAGKLAITKNPFAINYVSWISMANYGFKTLKWVMYDREVGKVGYAQKYIDNEWKSMQSNLVEKDIYIVE